MSTQLNSGAFLELWDYLIDTKGWTITSEHTQIRIYNAISGLISNEEWPQIVDEIVALGPCKPDIIVKTVKEHRQRSRYSQPALPSQPEIPMSDPEQVKDSLIRMRRMLTYSNRQRSSPELNLPVLQRDTPEWEELWNRPISDLERQEFEQVRQFQIVGRFGGNTGISVN